MKLMNLFLESLLPGANWTPYPIDLPRIIGTLASNIRRLEALKVEVIFQPGDFDQLQDHLQQNQPCIAFIHTRELSYWTDDVDHAVVVVGLDEQHIYLNDPAFPSGPLTVDRGEFDLAWLEWDEKYAVLTSRD